MDAWKIKYLEKEYKKSIKLGDTNIIWGKKAMKTIAQKLDFEESKVYKWCWERKKKDEDEENKDKEKPSKKELKAMKQHLNLQYLKKKQEEKLMKKQTIQSPKVKVIKK